jgi:hypothetical protein
VGGLIGKNITAAVSGCGAEGMVQASANAGGLIGQHAGGKITDCYAVAGVIEAPRRRAVWWATSAPAAASSISRGWSPAAMRRDRSRAAASGLVAPVTGAGSLFWDIEAAGCTTKRRR